MWFPIFSDHIRIELSGQTGETAQILADNI